MAVADGVGLIMEMMMVRMMMRQTWTLSSLYHSLPWILQNSYQASPIVWRL